MRHVISTAGAPLHLLVTAFNGGVYNASAAAQMGVGTKAVELSIALTDAGFLDAATLAELRRLAGSVWADDGDDAAWRHHDDDDDGHQSGDDDSHHSDDGDDDGGDDHTHSGDDATPGPTLKPTPKPTAFPTVSKDDDWVKAPRLPAGLLRIEQCVFRSSCRAVAYASATPPPNPFPRSSRRVHAAPLSPARNPPAVVRRPPTIIASHLDPDARRPPTAARPPTCDARLPARPPARQVLHGLGQLRVRHDVARPRRPVDAREEGPLHLLARRHGEHGRQGVGRGRVHALRDAAGEREPSRARSVSSFVVVFVSSSASSFTRPSARVWRRRHGGRPA